MERTPAKRIPKWKVNAREQVKSIASDKHVNFFEVPFQWNSVDFRLGPIQPNLTLNDSLSSLDFRCTIGEVNDTYGVDEIYEEFPIQGLNIEYELKPLSKVQVSASLPLDDSTPAIQILTFIRDCSMLALIGLQSLIHLGNLVFPTSTEIERYQVGPGQEHWGNPGIASTLIREVN